MKYFRLSDDNNIPVIGFGTWKLKGKVCYTAVRTALDMGYRHIDTADRYKNHKPIAHALKDSNVPREEVFIATKVWWTDLSKRKVIEKAHKFLKELQTEYIDLLLIHWPNRKISLEETLAGMQQLKNEGVIKSIGVSNFTQHHLQEALKTGVYIVTNQIEFHPSFSQPELKKFCDTQGVLVTGYSPLGQGNDIELPQIQALAQKYNCSSAQIILSWLVSCGVVAIPKATDPRYIKENLAALDINLVSEDILLINSLNTNTRLLMPKFADFDH